MTTNLAYIFSGIAYKRLRPTEVDPAVSHGHEFQGVRRFVELLGTEKRELATQFLFLKDGEDVRTFQGTLTWYDSRAAQAHRAAEYRLYYPVDLDTIQQFASPGDMILVGLLQDGGAAAFIAQQGSTWERQLVWLFGIDAENMDTAFQVEGDEGLRYQEVGVAGRLILDELGIEPPIEDVVDERVLFDRFPDGFPSTRELSKFARELATDVSPARDPDAALIRWVTVEEQAFRMLELRHWSQEPVNPCSDLDTFLEVSKSYQNRRKSRAGSALENQLEELLTANQLKFKRGGRTEGRRRPDFLFPSEQHYRDQAFPIDGLTVLGAKTSCKDRWRQVLSEAARVREKHLITLEPAISEDQTAEMREDRLQLIVPREIGLSYTEAQQGWLMTVADFVAFVRDRQSQHGL